jgi:hypothetical protein
MRTGKQEDKLPRLTRKIIIIIIRKEKSSEVRGEVEKKKK